MSAALVAFAKKYPDGAREGFVFQHEHPNDARRAVEVLVADGWDCRAAMSAVESVLPIAEFMGCPAYWVPVG